ncbi:MAG: aspartate aminotransferase family protein [Magnetospiraceae bacterium]
MNHVFHRSLKTDLPVADHGDGCYIVDKTGKRYLDASGGAAVSCLGHSDPDIRKAMVEQTERLAFVHSAFFTTETTEELADTLIASGPAGMDRIYFVSGGSEAVESAIKMARQYFIETGQPLRRRFIARTQSYHGNTLGALGVGSSLARRDPFAPMLGEFHHVSPCNLYRGKQDDETEAAYVARLASELEAKIEELGPESVAGFVAETVSGASMGAMPPAAGYFKAVRDVCDKHGVLLILDEVMCGMGRTGTLHACEQDEIVPDLMTVAKGLGAGYQPLGAVFVSKPIAEAFMTGSGAFINGYTYMGHAVACAAALAVNRAIQNRDLLQNVRKMGALLDDALQQQFGNHPHVGNIRGRGLFRGVELVADRVTRQPFDPKAGLNGRIKTHAMAQGLVCYPGGGTADGRAGDHVLLAPPFIIGETEVALIVERLSAAIEAAVAEVKEPIAV